MNRISESIIHPPQKHLKSLIELLRSHLKYLLIPLNLIKDKLRVDHEYYRTHLLERPWNKKSMSKELISLSCANLSHGQLLAELGATN